MVLLIRGVRLDGTRHAHDAAPGRGMTETDGEERTLQVPEGLGGERVDVALARMFGISRSKAAELLVARAGARRR